MTIRQTLASITVVLLFGGCAQQGPKEEVKAQEAFKGKIEKTFDQSEEYWPEKKHPPKNAPNVVLFLIDDHHQ